MKKFFALFLVVALLAVAGSAFATDNSISGHGGDTPPESPQQQSANTGASSGGEQYSRPIEQRNTFNDTQRAITINVPVVVVTSTVQDTLTSMGVSSTVAQAIQSAINNAVNSLLSTITAFANATVRESTNLDTSNVTPRVPASSTNAQKLAAAAQSIPSNERNVQKPAAVIPSFSPRESGVYTIPVPRFTSEFYGMPMKWYPGSRNKTTGTSSTFYVAANDTEAVFLNSSGDQVSLIPDGTKGEEAGFVSVATYLESGEEYDPVITVPTASVDANSNITTASTDVEITEISYTQGIVTETTEGFSNNVPFYIVEALAKMLTKTPGTDVVSLDNNQISRNARAAVDNTELNRVRVDSDGVSYDLAVAASIPTLQNLDNNKIYVCRILIGGTMGGRDIKENKFSFYPVTLGEGAKTVKVFSYTGNSISELKPSDINSSAGFTYNGTVYLAFAVGTDAVTDIEAANIPTLNPTLAVKRLFPATTPQTPTNNPTGPGDSSGGCSTGFAALALAVLGSFIATRKK